MNFCLLIFVAFIASAYSEDDPPKFYLTTGYEEDLVELTDDKLHLVDVSITTIFLIHGYIEDSTAHYYETIPREYHRKGAYNVVAVDWGDLAFGLYFLQSSQRVKLVGQIVGQFIIKLHNEHNLPLSSVHIVGHSLGAHVAGFAGKEVKKQLQGQRIGRISGLDPAGPNFIAIIFNNKDHRLDSEDADVVDNVYTNTGIFGTINEIGTVNFFANNGNIQPGCLFDDHDNLTKSGICSHQRSVSYYAESIRSDQFKASDCYYFDLYFYIYKYWCVKTDVVFGDNTAPGTKGVYFFDTHDEYPYALG